MHFCYGLSNVEIGKPSRETEVLNRMRKIKTNMKKKSTDISIHSVRIYNENDR